MTYLLYGAGLIVCVMFSALFSAAEMAISSANEMRLSNMAENGSGGAARAVKLMDRYDDALSAILIGNNLANNASSSISTVLAMLAAAALGMEEGVATLLSTIIITVIVIICGETIPKIIAKKNANNLSVRLSAFITVLTFVLKPLILVVVAFVRLLTHGSGAEKDGDEQEAAVEELQAIIETVEDEGVIGNERSELLQAALDFNEISVSEIMTARVDMLGIDIEDSWEDIMSVIEASPYSRLPVYEDNRDNILGILYLNRFFKAMLDGERPDIRAMLIEPCYVYKTVKLPSVLQELRRRRVHIAIVTDEYGGSMGLVTMEDVLEQIVGDIWDETDEIEDEMIEREEGLYELSGDMSIGDFLELLSWDEDAFDFDSETVGGWTTEMFGRFPEPGESFDYENLTVTVQAMDGLRVDSVLVRVKK